MRCGQARLGRSATTLAMLALGSVIAPLGSCRGPGDAREPAPTPARGSSIAASALAELRERAAIEQEAPVVEAKRLHTPPGVDALAVEPTPGTDMGEHSKALQGLDEALASLAARASADPPEEQPATLPPDNVDAQQARLEAISAYARARELLLDGQAADAAALLQQAARLDPGAGPVWRELGEAQLALNRRGPATAAFKQAVRLGAGGAGVFARLAQEARRAGQAEESAAYFARARQANPDDEDPALGCVVDAALGEQLAALGYWRAARDCLGAALDFGGAFGDSMRWRQEFSEVYRRRGELWMDVGDLSCRIGDYPTAAEAYERAGEVPLGDPGAPLPRRMHALLRCGHPAEAALLVLDSIAQSQGLLDDRHAALVRFLSKHASLGATLGAALREVGEQVQSVATPSVLSRLALVEAAALEPSQARASLRRSLLARPADTQTAATFLDSFGPGEVKDRADEIEGLVKARPAMALQVGEVLVALGRDVRATLDALAPSPGAPAQLARGAILVQMARFEDAAQVLDQPPEPARADDTLRAQWFALRVATAMALAREAPANESMKALESLDHASSPAISLAHAHALLAAGLVDEAADRARAACAESRDAHDLLDAARLELGAGRAQAGEQLAQRARTHDPFEEGVYATLLSLYAPSGPSADAGKFAEAARQLRHATASGRWVRVLTAREMIERSLISGAEPLLMDLTVQSPPDLRAVELLGTLAQHAAAAGAARDRALARLHELHAERPESPHVVAALARALAASGRAQDGVEALARAYEGTPLDDLARLRESLVRDALHQPQEAEAMAVARLRAAPPTLAHALELAELYVRRGDIDQGTRLLAERLPMGAAPTREQSQAMLSLLGRLPSDPTSPEAARAACDLMDAVEKRGVETTAPLAVKRLRYACVGRAGDPARLYEIAVATGRQVKDLGDGAFDVVLGALAKSGSPRDAVGFAGELATREQPFRPVYGRVWLALAGEFGTLDDVKRVVTTLDTDDRISASLEGLERAPGEARPRSRAAYVASNFMIARGREEEGLATLRYAVELDGSNHIACNDLGYLLLEQDRSREEVARLIESAYSGLNDDANVIDSLGWLRYKQGVLEDAVPGEPERRGAVTLLRQAVDLAEDGPNETSLDHLGDALWRTGRHEEALKFWRLAQNQASISLDQRRRDTPDAPQTKRLEQHQAAIKGKLDAVAAGGKPLIAATWAEH